MSQLGIVKTNSKGQTIKCASVNSQGVCSAWAIVSSGSNPSQPTTTNQTSVNGSRQVVLAGGAESYPTDYVSLGIPVRADTLQEAFNNAGWDAVVTVTSNYTTVGIKITANVNNAYSAETARQNALTILQNLKTGYFTDSPLLGNVFMQILSEGSKQVSKYDASVETVNASSVQNAGNVLSTATTGAANQIAKDGILPPVVGFWDKFLLGENVDLLGVSIPRWLIYGAGGLFIYKKLGSPSVPSYATLAKSRSLR